MKPITKEIYDILMDNQSIVEMLHKSMDDLARYHSDPYATVTDIFKSIPIDDDNYDIFKDLEIGLSGKYTRNEALILGRKNFEHVIKKYVDMLIANDEKLNKAAKDNVDIVKMNFDSLTSGYNLKELNDGYNSIKDIQARREYLVTNIYSIITPEISTTLESQKDMVQFINDYNSYIGALDYLPQSKDSIQTVKDYSIYYDDIESHINSLVKSNDLNSDDGRILSNNTIDKINYEPNDINVEEKYLLVEVNKESPIKNTNDDLFYLFGNILKANSITINLLQQYIDKTNGYIEELSNTKNTEQLTINLMKIISKYNDGEISKEVYEVISNIYIGMIGASNNNTSIAYEILSNDIKNLNDIVCMTSKSVSIIARVIDISKPQV